MAGNFPAPNMGVFMRGYRSLVGGFNHLETYEFVNGKDYSIYCEEKKMFQTTNQLNADFPLPRLTSEGYVYLLKWDI